MSPAVHGFAPDFVARVLAVARSAPTPFAIAGLQGSGKSTLARQVADAGRAMGLRVAALSLDDGYLDRPQRKALARDVHPLLATRGPPGTHDVPLLLHVLDALRDGRPVRVPRFDKLADRRLPERMWPRMAGCDVVLVDGWCLRVPPEPDGALHVPVNAIERVEDADGVWRRWCNAALARDYPALWTRLPRLLFLQPPAFEVVPQWRWEQECRATAEAGRPGMSREQLDRFVGLFERVSRHALRTLPHLADHVVRLDARRRPHARDVASLVPAPPTIAP